MESQGKKASTVINHDIIDENNVGAENVAPTTLSRGPPRSATKFQPLKYVDALGQFPHSVINPAQQQSLATDTYGNDTDEGFADGKVSSVASSSAGSVTPARGSVAGNAAGVDDDTYDCPLSVYSDYSSSRSGAVTPGSENNMNTNADDDDDDDGNTENINILQQPPVVPGSQSTKPATAEPQLLEQQWPKDHPRNPKRDPNLSDLRFRFRIPNAAFLRGNVLSPPHYLRGLPWKVFIMPKQAADQYRHNRSWQQQQALVAADKLPIASIGIFLQCNSDDTSLGWSCHGEAKIRLVNENNEIVIDRSVVHNFYHKENDWGFSMFMEYNKADWQSSVHSRDGALLIEIEATADPPHGTNWNSKRLTGYVGLKNQGATCYMNSLLQALYFTNYLRRAVYLISTELEDPSRSIPFQLQRLFFDLQITSKPASTKRLTQAFGWDSIDSLVQHDVEEFCRMLLDNLEDKLKGTAMEGAINQLFEGRTISYIKCKNLNYTSSRVETFMDVALNVKGLANVHDSFREYCAIDELVGDNQYEAGTHGKQDAIKGIKFVQFPPVLHLHLKRFTYDIQTGDFVKINEKFEFPQHLDLSSFLDTELYMAELQQQIDAAVASDDAAAVAAANGAPLNSSSNKIAELITHQPPPKYSLHAVFVHSGDHHGGHYVCYINPNCDGSSWFKFDDDVVSKCQARQAVEGNYGGNNDTSSRSCSNAYMLVYVRDFDRSRVLCPVQRNDLNPMFFIRLNRQNLLDARQEQLEARLNLEPQCTFKIYLDSDLRQNGTQPGMFDLTTLQSSLNVRMNVNDTWREAHLKLAHALDLPAQTLRIWPICRESVDNATNAAANHKFRLHYVHGPLVLHQQPTGARALADDASDVVDNYPNAPLNNNLEDAAAANLYMERKLSTDLLIGKPAARMVGHHNNNQQQPLNFAITNADEYHMWLQQSQDGMTPLPITSHTTHVLFFVKLYDPKYSLLHLERAIQVRYDDANSFRNTLSDLDKQLLRLKLPGIARLDDLWTWFEVRARDVPAIRLAPQLGASLAYELQQAQQRSVAAGGQLVETQAHKQFANIVSFDGEAIIAQKAFRVATTADLDKAKQLYRHPYASSYVYEQLNIIRLVLQEREVGGVGSQAALASALNVAAVGVSSATSSNSSLNTTSTTTAASQRMSPPVAGAGAVMRSHWPELVLEVSQLMLLSELQRLVAERLGIDDPRKIMFSKVTGGGNQAAGGQQGGNKHGSMSSFGNNASNNAVRDSQPIRESQLGKLMLADVFGTVPLPTVPGHARRRKLMLYTVFATPIEDFDSKREVEIYYLPDLRDAADFGGPGGVERTLFVNQQAHVSDLLSLVRQQFQMPADVPLRLLEVVNHILRQPPIRENVEIGASLFENAAKSKQFRVEPVPPDQRLLALQPNLVLSPTMTPVPAGARAGTPTIIAASVPVVERAELLMPVGHFHKETHLVFGTPFLVRVVDGDTFAAVKERIRNMIGVAEKEMEKWKLCIVHMGKRHSDDETDPDKDMPVLEFIRVRANHAATPWTSLWLGLDHVNNTQTPGRGGLGLPGSIGGGGGGQMKKVRGAAEKTLKIHN